MGTSLNHYLFDTNILIYYFADVIPDQEIDTIERHLKTSFNILIITKIEFYGFEKFSQDRFSHELQFIRNATVIPLTEDIADITIDLRRESKIKLPDAVIAATCLKNNLTLITRNEKDFCRIPELIVYNPFK
jgi:hypothetical protein